MQTTFTGTRVRLDTTTKENAAMFFAADEQSFSREAKFPNAETLQAIAELEAGAGHTSYSVAGLMAELHADD